MTDKKKYVLGFAFAEDGKEVLLIRKNRPEWQAGKFNGIGGKVEEGETPEQAMYREFHEEAGIKNSNWEFRFEYIFPNAIIYVYTLFSDGTFWDANTMTDETVHRAMVDDILKMEPEKLISNIKWLVLLLLDESFKGGTINAEDPEIERRNR